MKKSAKKKGIRFEKLDLDPKSVMGFYQLGHLVNNKYREITSRRGKSPNKTYVPGFAEDASKFYAVNRDVIDNARVFAKRFGRVDAAKLASGDLRCSQPLARRHVIALLSVKGKIQAIRLSAKCSRLKWSARRLEQELRLQRAVPSRAGRRRRQPTSILEAYWQLIDATDQWLRWHDAYSRAANAAESLGFDPELAKELLAAQRRLSKVMNLARRRLE